MRRRGRKILGLSEGRATGFADGPDCGGGGGKDVLLHDFPNLAADILKPFLLLPCSVRPVGRHFNPIHQTKKLSPREVRPAPRSQDTYQGGKAQRIDGP